MPDRDEMDLQIDSALRDYAEPRAGLEQRMLAGISGRQVARSSRRRWLWAAILVPAIAALVLLGYLVPWNLRPQPGQMAYTPAVPPVAPVVTAPAPHPTRKSVSSGHVQHRNQAVDRPLRRTFSRPKLDVFPTLQPLSTGEQALIRFASEAPEADRKALIEAQPSADEPLNISALSISPLRISEENQH
jgi:hypothetical protein